MCKGVSETGCAQRAAVAFWLGYGEKKTARAGGYGHVIEGKLLARWHIQVIWREADHLFTQPVIQLHHAVL